MVNKEAAPLRRDHECAVAALSDRIALRLANQSEVFAWIISKLGVSNKVRMVIIPTSDFMKFTAISPILSVFP